MHSCMTQTRVFGGNKDMELYKRDFNFIFEYERLAKEKLDKKACEGLPLGKRNCYPDYPIAVRHNLSLFPNNHLDLIDMKTPKYGLEKLNNDFNALIHATDTSERDILRFINKTPAYHIAGSILRAGGYNFGHHGTYLFPEFRIGSTFRPDYVIVGDKSGGHEFVFVELEKPNGRITLKSGYLGEVHRKGIEQIEDWKTRIDGHFSDEVSVTFEQAKNKNSNLPDEFKIYDRTRFHYVVVAGLREDFDENTRVLQRRARKERDICLLHYDNLFDASQDLLKSATF